MMDESSPKDMDPLGPGVEKDPHRRFFDYSGPVESISLDGATINWYTNVVEAATKTEVFEKGIKRCMKGDRITYGGLKWRRGAPQIIEEDCAATATAATKVSVKDISIGTETAKATEPSEAASATDSTSSPAELALKVYKTGVSIECMTVDGVVLHRFVDIKSIRKQANFPIERIQTVLRKQQQKSAGFYWRFYDENRENDSSRLITLEELLTYKETANEYKLLLPSQKKIKTRYEDVTASIVSSSRSSLNSTENVAALADKPVVIEAPKAEVPVVVEVVTNGTTIAVEPLKPTLPFSGALSMEFTKPAAAGDSSPTYQYWKDRVQGPL